MFPIYSTIFIFGLIFGSFYNVCIYRLESGESISKGRSHCQTCNHNLNALDLIPVFSYLLLQGKCRYCKEKISIRYPLVELLTGCLFVLSFMCFGFTWLTILGWIILSTLLILGFIDWDTMLIRDRFLVILILCSVVLIYLFPLSIKTRIIGAFCISIPLWIIAYITKGIGYGDVKLMFVSGLILGWQNNILAFIIGVISASIVALPQLISGKKHGKDEMPLGPFLSIGIAIAFLYGPTIISWYLNMF